MLLEQALLQIMIEGEHQGAASAPRSLEDLVAQVKSASDSGGHVVPFLAQPPDNGRGNVLISEKLHASPGAAPV